MKNLMFVFDRMPDQDGCTFIEVENEDGQSVNAGDWRLRADGLVELVVQVNYDHEFDEAKERELFELAYMGAADKAGFDGPDLRRNADGDYANDYQQAAWFGWSSCAKLRASS